MRKLLSPISLSLSARHVCAASSDLSLASFCVAAGPVAVVQHVVVRHVNVTVVWVYSVGVMCGDSVVWCTVVAVVGVCSIVVVERGYLAVVYTTSPPRAHGRTHTRRTVLFDRVRCL